MPITIRINLQLLDILDEITQKDFHGNRTDCVVRLIEDGLKLKKFQEMIRENPEKSDEIINEMDQKIKDESIYPWLDSLSDQRKKGIIQYINSTFD
tara:strand:- start:598 stop:885 length:288 start_codon:yes stop_codon:yes gene_type:complete